MAYNILFAKRGEDAWIYEMGIPIQRTEMAWDWGEACCNAAGMIAIGIALTVGGIQKRSMMEVIGAQMEVIGAQMKIMDARMKVLNDKTDDISKEIESLRQEYRADMKDVMSKLKVERN